METGKSTKKIIFASTIAALFFLIIIIALLLKTKSYPKKEKIFPSPTISLSTPIPTKKRSPLRGEKGGKVTLSATKKSVSLTKREKITVIARVDSDKRDVVGFDLIFKFDKEGLNLDKIISLSPDFKLFKKTLPDGEIITGIKKIDRKGKIILNDNQLIELTFIPKKQGFYTIAVAPADKIGKTQFVDYETKIIYPKIDSLRVTVSQ